MYNISEEESNRINILKFIGIIFVVYIHSYAANINFSSGTNNLSLPLWLEYIEYGLSHIVAKCRCSNIFYYISCIIV